MKKMFNLFRTGRAEPRCRACSRATSCSAGLSLIGIIVVVLILGLLAAGVFMLMSTGTFESVQAMHQGQAFFAAESGISAARYHMGVYTNWHTNASVTITGSVGGATFNAVLESDRVTSVGRFREAQWTSIWTGKVELSKIVAGFWEDQDPSGATARFPGNQGDAGQSFTTPTNSVVAAAIAIRVRSSVFSDSDLYMTLRANSTVGDILATSDIVPYSELPAPQEGWEWVRFTLDPPVLLAPETMYYIRVSSIPPSTDPNSPSPRHIHWVNRTPDRYPGGDAWHNIGADNDPGYPGEQQDRNDFFFRVYN